jgi:hypothetical protein
MATGLASAAMGGASGLIATNPIGALAILAATAFIDTRVIMPRLAGKGRDAAKSPELLGVPVDANAAGAPRVWAIGRRVRVPTHILWQDQKVRESTSGSSKSGTTVPVRRVYFDALVALNDRPTVRLFEMRGNGATILFDSLNFVDIATTGMVVSVGGGRVILTMQDNAEPDFADKFAVGDVVKLEGFINTAGQTLNFYGSPPGFQNYWKVAAVTAHTASGGSIELDPFFGQTVAGIVATAGTAAAPARIVRVDDVMFATAITVTDLGNGQQFAYRFTSASHVDPSNLFANGEGLTVANCVAPYSFLNATYIKADGLNETSLKILSTNMSAPTGAGTPNAAGTPVVISRVALYPFQAGTFPPSFVPANHFYTGSEDQGVSSLLAAVEGAGNVPAYRGIAYQGFDDFYATNFGDQLPFALEAVIEPDASMTWAQALALILQRSGIPDGAIDTTGIDDKPFDGFFLRGSVPAITAMQPLLVAGGILGQERDGAIALFSLPNADVVQIEHGDDFTDFAVRMDGEQPGELWTTEDQAQEDLPTSVGVRFQDFDNGLADGWQQFGLRNPDGIDWQNEQEVDVSNLVLTRKAAANLAATVLRRAHINRRTYTFTLGARYLHLLENDLVTWTDDEGQDHTARVIQRDIGADLRVAIVAIDEDVDVGVVGSPVQTAAGRSSSTPPSGQIGVDLLDVPALADDETSIPAIKVAAWPREGTTWSGGSVWLSIDGTNWTSRGIVSEPAAVGTFAADLAGGVAAEAYGTTTITLSAGGVDVAFDSIGVGLQSVTQAQAERGANWVALVAPDGTVEIAAFLTASLVSGTTYTLSGWLRGLRGTPVADRLEGTRLVVLTDHVGATAPGILQVEVPGTITSQSLAVKVVPAGRTTDDVDASTIVATWRNVLPLPVRSVSKTIGSSPFDARFTINHHWCREVLPLGTQPPHPLDEPREGYRLTIYDPTGSVVKRTKTKQVQPTTGSPAMRDKWFDYSASEQTQDGYTPSGAETFVIDIQQIGHFGIGPSIKQEI